MNETRRKKKRYLVIHLHQYLSLLERDSAFDIEVLYREVSKVGLPIQVEAWLVKIKEESHLNFCIGLMILS